jgi:hypothetical protein
VRIFLFHYYKPVLNTLFRKLSDSIILISMSTNCIKVNQKVKLGIGGGDIMAIAKPSIQSLFIQMFFNDALLSTGTAFVAQSSSGPVLITNRHNVTGRHQVTGQPLSSKTGGVPNQIGIIHNRKGHLGEWVRKIEPLYINEEPIWIEHPLLGPNADFVAIKLTQLDDVELYPYTLGVGDPKIQFGVSDIVSVVGFPFGLQGGGSLAIWATGFVATEPDIDFSGPVFLIDCRSREGQSGSAVISYRPGGVVTMENGEAVTFGGAVSRFHGIYSGRINKESDLGIVWKASAIQELVSSI